MKFKLITSALLVCSFSVVSDEYYNNCYGEAPIQSGRLADEGLYVRSINGNETLYRNNLGVGNYQGVRINLYANSDHSYGVGVALSHTNRTALVPFIRSARNQPLMPFSVSYCTVSTK